MIDEQKNVRDWMKLYGQATPDKPIIPDKEIRLLRAKLILEEALETIDALGVNICLINISKEDYKDNYSYIKFHDIEFEAMPVGAININSLKDIADGCEDLKVVTEGTLIACGLCQPRTKSVTEGDHYGTYNTRIEDITDPLFDEVMRSNYTKLWTYEEVSKLSDYHEEICHEINPDPQSLRSHRGWLVKNKFGKVIKSPSYSPPNLQPIINELAK